jgi:hypothetical protein
MAGARAASPAATPSVAVALPVADPHYYGRLEIGARWLAERAGADERDEHLAMADRYARLRRTTTQGGR